PVGSSEYRWYAGGVVAPGSELNTPASNPTATGLQGGAGKKYTVEVTLLSSGCKSTATVILPDAKLLPTLSLATVDNSICDPTITSPSVQFNGKITATVTNQVGPITDYTFTYGAGMNAGVQSTNGYDKLNGGATAYTVFATQTSTGCVSATASVNITNTQVFPSITTSMVSSTNCTAAPNGSVTVSGVTPVGSSEYRWYSGGVVVPGSELNTPASNPTATGLQGGAGKKYTVEVTLLSSGCKSTATVILPDAKLLPTLSLATVDNSICDPTITSPSVQFNGKITATVTNQVGPITDYTFTYGAGMNAGVQSTNVYDKLNGGATAYTVFATQTSTGCVSATASVNITNTQVFPSITTSMVSSTNCTAAPNGSVTVSGVTPVGSSEYRWYAGGVVAPGSELNTPASNPTATGLQGGAGKKYTVEVTLLSSGCKGTATVILPDAKLLPTLSLATVDNSICDP